MHRTTVFSHSQSVVVCSSCSAVLCTPTGGKARLTEGVPTQYWPYATDPMPQLHNILSYFDRRHNRDALGSLSLLS